MNWPEQAANSHYQTAVAISEQLKAGNVSEASAGIEELIEALSRSERRAIRAQLTRLMQHVFKWQTQPARRSRSWVSTIRNARAEIADIQEETPSMTDDTLRMVWKRCLDDAKDLAESEMNQEVSKDTLTWDEVFIQEYRL